MGHAKEIKHELVLNNFHVLSRCKDFDMKITESVLIHQMTHPLNNQEASAPLNILQ